MAAPTVSENLRKLFLGGLNKSTTEDDIRQKLEGYGNIVDLVVLKDKQTGASKCFGFVTFEQESEADAVLADRRQNGFKLGGRDVEIKHAIPREDASETSHLKVKQIFVGGIPRGITEEAVKSSITEWCAPYIATIDLPKKREDPSQLRGFGFLDFENEDIVDKLIIKQGLTLKDRKVEVKKAAPRDQMGEVGGGRGRGGRGGRGGSGGRGRGRGGGGYQQQDYGGSYSDGYSNGSGYGGGYGGGDYSNSGYGSGGGGYDGGYGGSSGGYGGSGGYGSGGGGYGGGGYGSGGGGGGGYGGSGGYGGGYGGSGGGNYGGSGGGSYGGSGGGGYGGGYNQGGRGGGGRGGRYRPY